MLLSNKFPFTPCY